jgi:hypothetical protein
MKRSASGNSVGMAENAGSASLEPAYIIRYFGIIFIAVSKSLAQQVP